ncbi:autophagy protein Apg16, putative [Trichophyton verrucosum HKI 0517]|uniref:Autophagy protein Apg16, putative n=1 Tax=Trichophyton verrucosum (strain HKI 0517) TaxID=663202 RepID=D4D7U6_TRIVH|nr:autophagy protein Apg16, putative [Trichophyton verrucosum HKI 0517]EFE42101.1 autophagy protein Apg16, putative [Trichophyton verrucosum HKI 0517]
MSSWRQDYSAALRIRDQQEKAYVSVLEASDRSGSLEKERAEAVRYAQNLSGSKENDTPQDKKYQSPHDSPAVIPGLDPLLTANQDLAAAQKAREELSNKLEKATGKIDTLLRKLNTESQRVADLAVERTQLQIRLRDRDEELRGKAKLLDDVQDELVTLNLQFNMAEERAKRFEEENQQLVDRWMARMGQEAEAMNKASRFS